MQTTFLLWKGECFLAAAQFSMPSSHVYEGNGEVRHYVSLISMVIRCLLLGLNWASRKNNTFQRKPLNRLIGVSAKWTLDWTVDWTMKET